MVQVCLDSRIIQLNYIIILYYIILYYIILYYIILYYIILYYIILYYIILYMINIAQKLKLHIATNSFIYITSFRQYNTLKKIQNMRAGWNLYIINFGRKNKQKGHWFIPRRWTHNSKKLQRTKNRQNSERHHKNFQTNRI